MLRQLLVLDAQQVHDPLPQSECIEAVELGLRELAAGHANPPLLVLKDTVTRRSNRRQ